MALVVKGTERCPLHAGIKLKDAKARGQVLMELKRWGLTDQTSLSDPGEVLLRLVTQSAARVDLYSSLLGAAYEAQDRDEPMDKAIRGTGVAALIGYRYGVDREGNRFPIEEAVRGLAQLEAQERDRLANFAAKAVAAGLAERQVRLAEAQGMLMVSVIRAILDDLSLSPEQQQRAGEIVARQLRAVAVGPQVIEGGTT